MSIFEQVFDRAFGGVRSIREHVTSRKSYNALREEGFSKEEADQLAWLYDHRILGRKIGIFAGLAFVYTSGPLFRGLGKLLPVLLYNNNLQWSIRIGLGFLTFQFIDFMFISRGVGSEISFTNAIQWSNFKYISSKDAFCQNFEVLNRKFTSEEIREFYDNQKTKNSDIARRFRFNPSLHGDDEDAFNRTIFEQYVQKIPPWERLDVQQKMAVENQEKVEHGEHVRVRPYNLLLHIDKTGIKSGLKLNPFVNNWQLL